MSRTRKATAALLLLSALLLPACPGCGNRHRESASGTGASPDTAAGGADTLGGTPLDPLGRIHVPIGLPGSLDALKSFVEAEGSVSPGFGTYGVYFWLQGPDGRVAAPTMKGIPASRGLDDGRLVPWIEWEADGIRLRTRFGQVEASTPAGSLQVVAVRCRVTNTTGSPRQVSLVAALRPLGPAGGPVRSIETDSRGDALLVDGHPAVVPDTAASAAGVTGEDVARLLLEGRFPGDAADTSATGSASGALRFDIDALPGETVERGFVLPVLPGRPAVPHRWDGVSAWAQLDLAVPMQGPGGEIQPDPSPADLRRLAVDSLLAAADTVWSRASGTVSLVAPDPRWSGAFRAAIAHLALCMNEGALDVAVTNYNVFTRDGVFMADALLKAGRADLAGIALRYLWEHPFSGRIEPEADSPGEILWLMGEYWRLTGDASWLGAAYPRARRLGRMIRYLRTAPAPHWVSREGLDFGPGLDPDRRHLLVPGRCDGKRPEYTEAFDAAGLRAAAELAGAAGEPADARAFEGLADSLAGVYAAKHRKHPEYGYGKYCVLWPCELFPRDRGPAFKRFRGTAAGKPEGWHYFVLASAHQGLLAGSREAGGGTIDAYLDTDEMKGWYVLDEGGASGAGGWNHALTRWKQGGKSVAMPHGWSVAEFWLLMRDCLIHEEGGRLVLLAGIPQAWFTDPRGVTLANAPTRFGPATVALKPSHGAATLELGGAAHPPEGYLLCPPDGMRMEASVDGSPLAADGRGRLEIPAGARIVRIVYR